MSDETWAVVGVMFVLFLWILFLVAFGVGRASSGMPGTAAARQSAKDLIRVFDKR